MLTLKTKTTPSGLEEEIDRVLSQMKLLRSDSSEYAAMNEQLVKLYSLKEFDSKKRVSADTVALVAGNLAGILLIVGSEKTSVITSKALGFVKTLR